MICDDFERSIEASMDDLEHLEYLTADDVKTTTPTPTPPPSTRFHKPLLPEIQENAALESNGSPITANSYRTHEFLQRKSWSSLTMPFQERRRLSQCKEEDADDDLDKLNKIQNQQHIAGARRKFIVTKMNESNIMMPRPEAENLRKLGAKVNAATIHFPCSSNNQRAPLAGLFAGRSGTFNPHLDKRFFDSSLVEVRVNTASSQSLNNPPPEIDEKSVWEPRVPSPDSSVSFSYLFFFLENVGVGFYFICYTDCLERAIKLESMTLLNCLTIIIHSDCFCC